MTSYRETVIKIAYYLKDGEKSTKILRKETGIDNITTYLQKNYYNWFVRVSFGVYKLTETGEIELQEYKDLFYQLNLIDK